MSTQPLTDLQVRAMLAVLGVKSFCHQHGTSFTVDFCEPCRVHWTRMAAGHLRDLVEGDARDLASVALGAIDPEDAHIPVTLAEAVDEVDALATAIERGDIS